MFTGSTRQVDGSRELIPATSSAPRTVEGYQIGSAVDLHYGSRACGSRQHNRRDFAGGRGGQGQTLSPHLAKLCLELSPSHVPQLVASGLCCGLLRGSNCRLRIARTQSRRDLSLSRLGREGDHLPRTEVGFDACVRKLLLQCQGDLARVLALCLICLGDDGWLRILSLGRRLVQGPDQLRRVLLSLGRSLYKDPIQFFIDVHPCCVAISGEDLPELPSDIRCLAVTQLVGLRARLK